MARQGKKVPNLLTVRFCLLPTVLWMIVADMTTKCGCCSFNILGDWMVCDEAVMDQHKRVLDSILPFGVHTHFLCMISSLAPSHMLNIVGWAQEVPEIKAIADKHNTTTGQVLLQWGIKRGVSVIPRAGNPVHLKVSSRNPFGT